MARTLGGAVAAVLAASGLVACAPAAPAPDATVVVRDAVEAVGSVDGALVGAVWRGGGSSELSPRVYIDDPESVTEVVDEVFDVAWHASSSAREGISIWVAAGPMPDDATAADPGSIDLRETALALELDESTGSHVDSFGTMLFVPAVVLAERYGARG